jgi:hypothetical protein
MNILNDGIKLLEDLKIVISDNPNPLSFKSLVELANSTPKFELGVGHLFSQTSRKLLEIVTIRHDCHDTPPFLFQKRGTFSKTLSMDDDQKFPFSFFICSVNGLLIQLQRCDEIQGNYHCIR